MKRVIAALAVVSGLVGCAHATIQRTDGTGEVRVYGAHFIAEPKGRDAARQACGGYEPADFREESTGNPITGESYVFRWACPKAPGATGSIRTP